jgi:hypothetical protein
VGYKNGMVGTNDTSRLVGCNTIHVANQVSKNCETAERRVEIKIGTRQSGLLLSTAFTPPDLLAGASGNEMSGILN